MHMLVLVSKYSSVKRAIKEAKTCRTNNVYTASIALDIRAILHFEI